MPHWLKPTELTSDKITLVPMTLAHRDQIVEAAADGNLWELWYTGVPSAKSIDGYLESAMQDIAQGAALPFVIIDNASSKVIGSSRYCHATPEHRRVEIGYTFYSKSFQRTSVNTHCKMLMLSYAFEQLDTIAVEFRTHWHNHASRAAIARLGAKQDGVLRNHSIDADGALRDTVVFSILQSEWLTVKKSLQYKLTR